jgi:hypothetical protein
MYEPTKTEIRSACEEIRSSWSEIRERHATSGTRKPWKVPVISVAELDPRVVRAIDAFNRSQDTYQDV